MTAPVRYHERTIGSLGDPLAAAARFARRAQAPVTVYEQDGVWSCGSGALAEIVLYWDELHYRVGAGWQVEPVGDTPLRDLARVLAGLPVMNWQARGWAGFELGPRTLGLPGPLTRDPLVHLVIPALEARLSADGVLLRAAEPSDLDLLAEILSCDGTFEPVRPQPLADLEHDGDEYRRMVAAAVEDIHAGRLQKVILSRTVPVDGEIDLIATYEQGRRGNTPARSFLLDLDGLRATGFSPETVVEVSPGGRVSTQPLAGTAAFDGGADAVAGDRRRREALLRDPKEIYEHAVSVQAAQEELRPLCAPGSLVVDEFMNVLERGSVQHLASRISGQLAPGRDGWDALAAVFPSITATGVPKKAACTAIRRYESVPRGLYSGAVINVGADGCLDAALVLRTVFEHEGRTWLRAGAGIVGASQPERELEETREKLRSISRFLVPARPTGPGPAAAAPARSGAADDLEALRRTVAELIEEDPATLSDDDNLFERGLESIALIRAVGQWRRSGIEVNFAQLAETPTLDGWFKLLGGDRVAPAPVPEPAGEEPAGEEPDGEEFALALMQHAYWIGRGSGQPYGGVAAHLYTEFDGSDVEPDRLSAAIERLIGRHPALRTRITDNGAQVVETGSGWRGLNVHDLRDLDQDQAAARLDAVRDQLSHQMLEIEQGEVFSTALSLLPGGRTRFHLDVDMVAADAISYRVLLADLAREYGNDQVTPAPAYSYRRYRAEHETSRQDAAERARQAWLDRLPGLPGPPQLPLAPAQPPASGGNDPARPPRVSRRHFRLPPAARDALGTAAHHHGVTPAMAVATAFAEVLGGWSSQPRFLLNVPLFDREPLHPDVPRIVGDFTSSVLLEIDLTDRVPFVDRARRVQTRLHADAAQAEYSGVEVLRDLSRRDSEPVLAPIVFTSALGLGELFEPAVGRELGRPGWIISQGPQVLLDAQVTELDGGLLVNWDVREDTFAPGVVDAMFTAFERLVRALAEPAGLEHAGPAWDTPVDGLLDARTREVREKVGAVTGPASTRLLHEGFFAAAARCPDAPALLWDEPRAGAGPERRSLSYATLAARASSVAGALAAHGVRPGDTVAVRLPRGPEQVVAVLGVLAAGAAYLPIGVEQPPTRIARIAGTAGFSTVLVGPDAAANPVGDWPVGVRPLPLDQALRTDPAEAGTAMVLSAAEEPARLEEPAYVLFTSGSTGQPKGVEVSHRAAMNTIDDLVERLGLGPDDRTLAVSALDFDLSVFDLFAPLSCGGAVVIVDEASRREATRWAELIASGVTVLNCVPTVLDLILAGDRPLGPSLRAVLLGGDRVGTDLPARLEAAAPGCRFLGLGGTTETAIHSTVCEVAGAQVPPDWTCVPYGTPLRNVRLRVVDGLGRDCPDHVAGELWIGGAGVARGYRADPARTADRFVQHDGGRWYRTGDLARYRPDGTVEFLGRRDHQVKLRGYRVELGEVEAALGNAPGIRAGVAALTGGAGGRPAVLGALVLPERPPDDGPPDDGVPDDGVPGDAVPGDGVPGGVDLAAIRAALLATLPAHMVPDRIVVVSELPLSANAKIDRRAVTALLAAELDGPRPAAKAPRSDLERVVLAIWQQVLKLDGIGISDEFFALGGDSVLATALVARLREELDTNGASVRMLFGAPTVATLADSMRAAETIPGRLDRVASIAWEIAGLNDEEIEAQLLADPRDPAGIER